MSTALVVANDVSDNAVANLEAIEARLTTIGSLEQATEWHAEIAAIQHYLKRHRAGVAALNRAALFKFKVEWRAGELLRAVPRVQGKRDGSDGLLMALKRSGISPQTGYRWMSLSRIPAEELARWAEMCNHSGDELSSTLVYEVLVRQHHERGRSSIDWQGQPPYLIEQQLIEWDVLEKADLTDLVPRAQAALVWEIRAAYEDYVIDPWRGKVTQEEGWNPAIVIDRRALRVFIDKATAGLRSGSIITSADLRRVLCGFYDDAQKEWDARQRGGNKAYKAAAVFSLSGSTTRLGRGKATAASQWLDAGARFLRATEKLLADDRALYDDPISVALGLDAVRGALDEVQRRFYGDAHQGQSLLTFLAED